MGGSRPSEDTATPGHLLQWGAGRNQGGHPGFWLIQMNAQSSSWGRAEELSRRAQ